MRKESPCKICGKISIFSTLKAHLLTHSGGKPFSCNHCENFFSRMEHLQYHKLIHTGEKLFSCDQCKKSFSMSHSLKTHEQIHSEEKLFRAAIAIKPLHGWYTSKFTHGIIIQERDPCCAFNVKNLSSQQFV